MEIHRIHAAIGSRVRVAAAVAATLFVLQSTGCQQSQPAKTPADPNKNEGSATDFKTEPAVEAHLRWLARHQDPDGAWSPDHFDAQCANKGECAGAGYPEHKTGATGLAILAFLGAGHTERSTAEFTDAASKRVIKIADVVRNGLQWLRNQQNESGSFVESNNHKWGYNHGIATLAMCEACGLTRAPEYKDSAQKAVNALLAGQSHGNDDDKALAGWRYQPKGEMSDISVTGWCTIALVSAKSAGLNVSDKALDGAWKFVREVTEERNGQVGYTKREEAGQQVKAIGKNDTYKNHPSFAAIGMCVRALTQKNMKDPVLEKGALLLAGDPPAWDKVGKSNDYYYWYFGTLALNLYDSPDRGGGGESLKAWNEQLKRSLLDHQTNNRKRCDDGSWDSDDRWGYEGGRVSATALAGLAFETYYRYKNAPAAHR
ncbi:MAG: terpene cyclase/mutase family protein [Planctomycetes bacterium]|nr:terpene cyclase/mutase family protein [Planctomycetota bacterium]